MTTDRSLDSDIAATYQHQGPLSHFQMENRFIPRQVYIQLIKNLGLDPDTTHRIVLDADKVTIDYGAGLTVTIAVEPSYVGAQP